MGGGAAEHVKERAFAAEVDPRAKSEAKAAVDRTSPERRLGLHFWYRQSPRYLIPLARYAWMVSADDPPPDLPGMAGVRLKGNGELIEFYAVPPASGRPGEPAKDAGWERLFKAAGLDMTRFSERADGGFVGPAMCRISPGSWRSCSRV
jgi:hypothetical protein